MMEAGRTKIDELREQLAGEFERVAAEPAPASRMRLRRKSRLIAAAAFTVVLIPTGLALAGVVRGERDVIRWDGKTVTWNGEVVDCPAMPEVNDVVEFEIQREVSPGTDPEGSDELGFNPCEIMIVPAPPPRSSGSDR